MKSKEVLIKIRDMPSDCPATIEYGCVYALDAMWSTGGFGWPVTDAELGRKVEEAKEYVRKEGYVPRMLDERKEKKLFGTGLEKWF